jgi:hypothetical protein
MRGNIRGLRGSDEGRSDRAAALTLGMSDPVQELNKCRPKHLLRLKRADADNVREGERVDLLDEEAHISRRHLIGLPNESRVGHIQKADVLIVRATPLGISRHEARKVTSARGRPVDVVVARRQDALHYRRRWRHRRSADEAEALEHSTALLSHLFLEEAEVERERHLVWVPERAVARSGYLLLR